MKKTPLFFVCLSIVCFGLGCSKKTPPKPTPKAPEAAKTTPETNPTKAEDKATDTPDEKKDAQAPAAQKDTKQGATDTPAGESDAKENKPEDKAEEKSAAKDDEKKDAPDTKKEDASNKAAATSGGDPSKTVKAYLQAGIKRDKKRVKQLVQAKCYSKRNIMNVSALDMMGMRMRVKSVAASTSQRKGNKAKVKAHISGSVKGSSSGTKSLFGKKVKFNIKNVKASSVKVTRTFDLVRIDGRWLISC